MSVIRKFIINRNDIEHIYAEQHLVDKDIFEYHIIDENGLHILNMDFFNSIYSADKKITVENFLINAMIDMQTTGIEDENIPYIYDNAYKILSRIKGKNMSNPILWGYSHTLIDTINKYNNFLQKKLNSRKEFYNEINYEEEYKRIKQEL